jgi:RNA-directed DNA polymerase
MSVGLLREVRRIETLGRAWRVICENGRSSQSRETRREIEEFATQAESRLTKIQRQLNLDSFVFAAAIGLEVPKKNGNGIRPLVIAPIESRIVQRAIHDVLLSVPSIRDRAENPFSFGGVRRKADKRFGAVPAAIEAVMDAVACGAFFVIRADISSFFTRIPKAIVTNIITDAINDDSFVKLFSKAIDVELANLAMLTGEGSAFPLYEIGVAQGNSR